MDLKKNIDLWNSIDHWETGSLGNGVPLKDGEKWSVGWGDSRFQWYASLLPRIHAFLPTGTILEIACGRGRWSQYLKSECKKLILMDISENCVEFCRERFADEPSMEFHVGEGSELSFAADESVDFVFSFDSLVHADISVLEGYIRELGRILKPGGGAFLHHSNLAACDVTKIKNQHLRDPSSSARAVSQFLRPNGLDCVIYELMPWDINHAEAGVCTDALLTLRKRPMRGEARVVRNTESLELEKATARKLFSLYGG